MFFNNYHSGYQPIVRGDLFSMHHQSISRDIFVGLQTNLNTVCKLYLYYENLQRINSLLKL